MVTTDRSIDAHAATFDWSLTPLGALEQWPACQRDALRVCLAADFPMALWLGPKLLLCGNQAWNRLLSTQAAAGMGRPGSLVLAEYWAQLGPVLQQAYDAGRPCIAHDLPFGPTADEPGWSWFISPVFDEHGATVALSTALIQPPAAGSAPAQQRTTSPAADPPPATAAETAAALARSEQRFRRVIESRLIGVLFANTAGVISDANDVLLELLGYRRDELIGTPWSALTPPEYAAADACAAAELYATGSVAPYAKAYLRKDGSRVPVLVGATMLQHESAAEGFEAVAIVIDSSEHKRAEQALELSERRFRALAEAGVIGVILADATGRILEANAAFLDLLGLSEADLAAGITWQQLSPAEGAARDGEQDRLLKQQGAVPAYEKEFVRRDGSRVAVLIGAALVEPEANFGVGFVLDITERKAAEQALRRSETRFRTLFEQAAVGVAEIDTASGRFLQVNRRYGEIVGYHPEEMQAVTFQALTHPDDLALDLANMQRLVAGEIHEFAMEKRYFRKDGTTVWVQLTVSPMWAKGEPPSTHIAIVEDITARKQAEAQRKLLEAEREQLLAREQAARKEAEEASRLKDEFLATVSHELRTPLTAFLGYAQLLGSRKRDEAYVERTVAKMLRSARAQAQLIEDLLDISRVVSGKLRLDPAPISLLGVVRAALETVRPAATARELSFAVTLDPAAGHVVGDAGRLQQVVWNLLTNAVKFTPPGGTVTVTLTRRDGYAVLEVRDTGQGIPSAFLPHVFERFRQADGSTNRAYGGLGLGLAIVRHLVELHGGSVEAHSDGPGQGANFRVWLPLAAEELRHLATQQHNGASAALACPPELDGLRVLVVDDQPELLELVHDILAPCGANVRLCDNAREALETLRNWHPQLLLSDVAMPGEDGYWLIEQVRALPAEQGGATPALALTAYVRMEDRLRVLAAGFAQYVAKPVEPAELRAAVARLFAPPAG